MLRRYTHTTSKKQCATFLKKKIIIMIITLSKRPAMQVTFFFIKVCKLYDLHAIELFTYNFQLCPEIHTFKHFISSARLQSDAFPIVTFVDNIKNSCNNLMHL